MEGTVRRILRDAALGELGSDLNEAADETLIATGLDAGDAEVAVAASLVAPEPAPAPEPLPSLAVTDFDTAMAGEEPAAATSIESREEEEYMQDDDTRIMEPIPAEDDIRITATHWLDEVEAGEDASTIEWPAGGSDVEHRERIDTPRVRHLFPVPEDAEWEVRELDYDHYESRRAG
jgi:hypothetical protein